jgi:LDH2 family malate/lactate/ureidoglycolate dehydrogenase
MLLDDTVRLPGVRRYQAAAVARSQGIEVAPALLAQLQALAAG